MEILSSMGVSLIILVILAFILVTSAVKVVQEYERGVIFRLGRLIGRQGARACSSSSRSSTGW